MELVDLRRRCESDPEEPYLRQYATESSRDGRPLFREDVAHDVPGGE